MTSIPQVDAQSSVSVPLNGPAAGADRIVDLSWCLCPESRPLTLFQRILVTTDGMVTQVLEAYAGERIHVVKLRQALEPAGPGHVELAVGDDEMVLRRTVVLQGQDTGRNFVYADSLIVPDRVDLEVRERLVTTDTPIGKLLAERRVETFREMLVCGQEPAGSCASHLGLDETELMVFRRYRIISGGLPIMLITEKFPLTLA